jgi:hypothetical protein
VGRQTFAGVVQMRSSSSTGEAQRRSLLAVMAAIASLAATIIYSAERAANVAECRHLRVFSCQGSVCRLTDNVIIAVDNVTRSASTPAAVPTFP